MTFRHTRLPLPHPGCTPECRNRVATWESLPTPRRTLADRRSGVTPKVGDAEGWVNHNVHHAAVLRESYKLGRTESGPSLGRANVLVAISTDFAFPTRAMSLDTDRTCLNELASPRRWECNGAIDHFRRFPRFSHRARRAYRNRQLSTHDSI